jgi:hypothetical protein
LSRRDLWEPEGATPSGYPTLIDGFHFPRHFSIPWPAAVQLFSRNVICGFSQTRVIFSTALTRRLVTPEQNREVPSRYVTWQDPTIGGLLGSAIAIAATITSECERLS